MNAKKLRLLLADVAERNPPPIDSFPVRVWVVSFRGLYPAGEAPMAAERDQLGNRLGTRSAKINAVLTITPKSTKQIIEESAQRAVNEHLHWLLDRGFVYRTRDGKEAFWALRVCRHGPDSEHSVSTRRKAYQRVKA